MIPVNANYSPHGLSKDTEYYYAVKCQLWTAITMEEHILQNNFMKTPRNEYAWQLLFPLRKGKVTADEPNWSGKGTSGKLNL